MFKGKKVVLGITGGIAAYKAADLASWLTKNGADVHTAMTKNACEFITPLTLQSLTNRPVALDIFATGPYWQVVHIALVENADLMVIVPATANFIAKAANGIADDLLSSSLLAAVCPVVFVPAMNVNMYENPATQANIEILRNRGFAIIEPAVGRLACGTEGKGRLPEISVIQKAITEILLPKQDLLAKKVLITAGPTKEPIDPVRYITNRSSGKMGYAIAEAAKKRGAEVILVSGAVNLAPPRGVNFIPVETALEMRTKVFEQYNNVDVVIKAAAVADYAVACTAKEKIKKTDKRLVLELVKNPDILLELGELKQKQILVGFAAETNNLLEHALVKIKAKNLDMIVANDVSAEGAGFDCATNIVTMINKDGSMLELPKLSKAEVADAIWDRIITLPAWC